MGGARISCFMIVKNVISQGYPFVEAIAAALPLCDEFLVSDGYSTDGTFEVLKRISELNKRVKIYRDEWPTRKDIKILAEVTNKLRRRCRLDYIFYIQANEIVHEASIDYLRALPEMFPTAITFSLPYLQLLGSYRFSEDFRLRYSRNLPFIEAIGDAWTLGASIPFRIREAIRSITRPRRLLRYISRGISFTYANYCVYIYTRATYPPKPIFRYHSVFPANFFEKVKGHLQMFGEWFWVRDQKSLEELMERLKADINNPDRFWEESLQLLRQWLGITNKYQYLGKSISLVGKYPESLKIVPIDEHPKIMRGLLANHEKDRYYVREEVLELIRDLR